MLCEPEKSGLTNFLLVSLNPCSNGRCSARVRRKYILAWNEKVLILVLMEDALRVLGIKEVTIGSNPS